MATTAPFSIHTLGEQLETKNAEMQALQEQLDRAQRSMRELHSTQKELEVALAQGAPGAEDRLRALHLELSVAAGRISGLEQLVAQLQPQLEQLREQWSELRAAEMRQQRQQEIDRLAVDLHNIDMEVDAHQAEIETLSAKRRDLFERRRALLQAHQG